MHGFSGRMGQNKNGSALRTAPSTASGQRQQPPPDELTRTLLFEPTVGSPDDLSLSRSSPPKGGRWTAEQLRGLQPGSKLEVARQASDGGGTPRVRAGLIVEALEEEGWEWYVATVVKNNSTTKRHADMLKVSYEALKAKKHDEWISYAAQQRFGRLLDDSPVPVATACSD